VTPGGPNALVRTSLAEAIRQRLRAQILSGELQMGERLTEQGVAEAMGTSAGPVREAFAGLTYEGLIISFPHRGTFVSSVSEEEARGAYEIRGRLEPYAFELAAGRLTPEHEQELEGILAELRTSAAGVFYAASGNQILASVWPLLEGTIRKFVAVAGPQFTQDLDDIVRRHQLLLDSVRAGDLRAVNRELADHGQDIWRNLPAPGKGVPKRRRVQARG